MTYVPDEIISRWPDLIKLSNYVFPNMTELRLIAGFSSKDDQDASVYIQCFQKKYTDAGLIVTSFKNDANNTGVLLIDGDNHFQYQHSRQSKNFGGTGDAFMAYFILYHIYNCVPVEAALQQACDKIQERILKSIETGSDELIL
jgi:pyridoxal/pyridoxine/pyridoxamine kinase